MIHREPGTGGNERIPMSVQEERVAFVYLTVSVLYSHCELPPTIQRSFKTSIHKTENQCFGEEIKLDFLISTH